jgi:calcium-dependent protein kinase
LDNVTNHYTFKRVLGNGHFGIVREATRIAADNQINYAIKSINKETVVGNERVLKRELQILRTLDHPSIIKLYEIYEDAKYLHLVTECCYGGDLFDKIVTKGGYPEKKAQVIMKKLFEAVNHMHASNIAHRDLKPENILFVGEDDDDSEIKLIDFGLSS